MKNDWHHYIHISYRCTSKRIQECERINANKINERWCIGKMYECWNNPGQPMTVLRLISNGNKTVHRQDNSPTRFLKTVHRQIWRQFTDTFEDSSSTLFYHVIDIWLENIIDCCEEILMSYDLKWYNDIVCWESDILFVWLMINIQTFDCYM